VGAWAYKNLIAELRVLTGTALGQAFSYKQKEEGTNELHLAVVTHPGAEAQVAHFKVAQDEDKCFSVLLHRNATAESIRLLTRAADLSLLRELTKEKEEHELTLEKAEQALQIKQTPDDHFASRPASAGAALLFRTDVAHFDPALAVGAGERVLLYALYAPSRSRQQD